MKQLDPAINNLDTEELRAILFGRPAEMETASDAVYSKLSEILRRYPIRYKKICIIVPPLQYADTIQPHVARARRYMTHIPYGSLCLSASVHRFKPEWQVEVVELNVACLKCAIRGEDYSFEAMVRLIPQDCDFYGVSWMFVSAEHSALTLMRYLKDKGKFVVTGGVQATSSSEDLLKHNFADIVVKREGEANICRLLSLWEESQNKNTLTTNSAGIVNVSFTYNGEVVSFPDGFENPVTPDIREEYRKINIEDYNVAGSPSSWVRILAHKRLFANVLNTRGCRGQCVFCQCSVFMGPNVRVRSVDDVFDEICFLYNEKGVSHIEWVDDDLLADRTRILELLRRISEANMDISFSTANAVLAISIDDEIAQAMSDARFVHIGFGVETGSELRLKTLRKPASLKRVRRACDIFKKSHPNIWVHANFMLGYPNETHQEMMETFNYAKSLGIDWCACAVLQPLKNTPIYSDFVALDDERVTGSFGKNVTSVASPGRDSVYKGRTFDDIFDSVVDFRNIDADKVATKIETQQFHIYFTVFVNLLGNINLTSQGFPERLKMITEDTLQTYPFDVVSWGVNAKVSLMLGDEQQYEKAIFNYKKTLAESRYWSEFFDVYDIKSKLALD